MMSCFLAKSNVATDENPGNCRIWTFTLLMLQMGKYSVLQKFWNILMASSQCIIHHCGDWTTPLRWHLMHLCGHNFVHFSPPFGAILVIFVYTHPWPASPSRLWSGSLSSFWLVNQRTSSVNIVFTDWHFLDLHQISSLYNLFILSPFSLFFRAPRFTEPLTSPALQTSLSHYLFCSY